MILTGYSKAMCSTWVYYRPLRTLFDAGEGINSALEGQLTTVRNVFLSHAHTDHFMGLPNILAMKIRHATEASPLVPTTVLYPEGDATFSHLQHFMGRLFKLPKMVPEGKGCNAPALEWIPLKAEQEVKLPAKRDIVLEVFPVEHKRRVTSLGATLVERGMGVRPEYQHLSPQEIGSLIVKEGKEAVLVPVSRRLVTYVGDCLSAPPEAFVGTKVLLHEATFLKEEDREELAHATAEEAIATALACRCEHLFLYHLSSRYSLRAAAQELRRLKRGMDCPIPILVIPPGQVVSWEGPGGKLEGGLVI